MVEFLQKMTPGDWFFLFFAVVGAFGSLGGFVWWLSAVYAEMTHTRGDLAAIGKTLTETTTRFTQGHEEHREKLENHEGRLIRLEAGSEHEHEGGRTRPRRGQ